MVRRVKAIASIASFSSYRYLRRFENNWKISNFSDYHRTSSTLGTNEATSTRRWQNSLKLQRKLERMSADGMKNGTAMEKKKPPHVAKFPTWKFTWTLYLFTYAGTTRTFVNFYFHLMFFFKKRHVQVSANKKSRKYIYLIETYICVAAEFNSKIEGTRCRRWNDNSHRTRAPINRSFCFESNVLEWILLLSRDAIRWRYLSRACSKAKVSIFLHSLSL